MSFIATLISSLFVTLLSASPAIAAERVPEHLYEPVFGLRYATARAHFPTAPAIVLQYCGDQLTNPRWGRQIYVYASSATDEGALYVLGGYLQRRSGAAPAFAGEAAIIPDKIGVLLRLQGDRCELIGPARESFDSPPEEIKLTDLDTLATALIAQYRTAFGSKADIPDMLRRQRLKPPAPSTSILGRALNR